MSLEEYEIVRVLGQNSHSRTFMTKYKTNNELFVWKEVRFDYLDTMNIEKLQEKIQTRVCLSHPNILKFQKPIEGIQSESLYLVTKFCKNGSLKDMIQFCLKNNKRLTEEFLCKILYQVVFAIKTIDNFAGKLHSKEIFFDEGFNVQLYNFELESDNDATEYKMSRLGALLFNLCTLEEDMSDFQKKLKNLSEFYSKNLLLLISSMVKDNGNLRENIDKILCHPTVLLNSAQWSEAHCFMEINEIKTILDTSEGHENSYSSKIKKLRSKEIALKMREQKLNDWEYRLTNREKKIASMERTMKEKLQQAELYLKRCRENKSNYSSETSKHSGKNDSNINSDQNLDSTYISVGESVILPTSKKLNVNEIVKPAPFTRTLSDRRIRFKGHSPLKDIDFNKRKNFKQLKKIKESKSDWITCSEDNDRSSAENDVKMLNRKCKELFPKHCATYENNYRSIMYEEDCEPIKWTEENKKYAFRLLRMMNDEKENNCEVKHTYL
ncbi:serine/threonine-protein kinase Nek2 [Leptinotarsa decemlineata]|uniref:serine/threonine-protein kinase Nek2 n=1 Tax=Leptinotarsa decemlineata TaxID=7539 RepID=UPI003D30549C